MVGVAGSGVGVDCLRGAGDDGTLSGSAGKDVRFGAGDVCHGDVPSG